MAQLGRTNRPVHPNDKAWHARCYLSSEMKLAIVVIGAAAALGATACGGDSFSGNGGGTGGAAGSGSGATGGGATGGSAGTGGGAGGAGGSGGSGGSSGSGGGGGSAGSGNDACGASWECTLLPTNCCGYCSEQPLSSFVAVSAAKASAVQQELCGPDPIACPACVTVPHPHYTAVCEGGRCRPLDVRQSPATECTSASDCSLRWGAGCCEPCFAADPANLVALNKSAIDSILCEEPAPCDECAPAPYPDEAVATCESGRCSVAYMTSGG